MSKKCTGCQRLLSLSDFRKNAHSKDGLQHRCKDCVRAYRKQYYWSNRERIRASEAALRPRYTQRQQDYQERTKERTWAYHKEYNKRPEVKARYSKWSKAHRHAHPTKRLTHSLRVLLNRAVKGKHKSNRALGFLGCDIESFKAHLEFLFQEGMTWQNYGRSGWHIDHIIPCSRFDFTNPEEQARCFHYTNMQPLWAHENLRKHNKLPTEIAA